MNVYYLNLFKSLLQYITKKCRKKISKNCFSQCSKTLKNRIFKKVFNTFWRLSGAWLMQVYQLINLPKRLLNMIFFTTNQLISNCDSLSIFLSVCQIRILITNMRNSIRDKFNRMSKISSLQSMIYLLNIVCLFLVFIQDAP